MKLRTGFFTTAVNKKRLVGLLLIVLMLALFFSFNRFPKLDTVRGDLGIVFASSSQQTESPGCFQGFCIEGIDEDTESPSLIQRWVIFSVTYLRLVTIGMIFAFLMAGVAEAFIFSDSSGRTYESGSVFKRTIKGLAAGPVLNLCSACIVPISSTFRGKGGGIAGAISMVQGSATLNIPALAMAFFVFTPLLGFSRLILAVIGGLLIGPIVVMATRRGASNDQGEEPVMPTYAGFEDTSPWGAVLQEGFRDWARVSIGYLIRLGPIMIVAGFGSGLVMQWLTVDTAETYLGNHALGVALAATFGILINVPLLFEIPLVALLLLLGMGTAPAATLLFTAAAGGPVTFWGLAKVMPRRAIATFATATWAVGALGGFAILAFHTIPLDGFSLRGPAEFIDVTEKAGVNFVHHHPELKRLDIGAGVIVFDYDGDGLDDIYIGDSIGSNALYRNNGDGTFTDNASSANVDNPNGKTNGGCAADYDNDGDQDLYITNYGSSKLFQNNGNATFTDVTIDSLEFFYTSRASAGCAWGDYDNDGYLDLLVVHHINQETPMVTATGERHLIIGGLTLFHSRGDGTFEDATPLLGDDSSPSDPLRGGPRGNVWGAGFQPIWIDFDNDFDLDIYVANDFGMYLHPNVFWRNDGNSLDDTTWTFVDTSEESGTDLSIFAMGLAVGDYDLDGFFDLFITNIGRTVLLKNNGDGLTFSDQTDDANVDLRLVGVKERVTWGTVFFDHDNDGYEDLYVVSGHSRPGAIQDLVPPSAKEQPNVLLRNIGNGTFKDISKGSGADDPGVGRGGVYLDYDSDGCLDLFVGNLGQESKLFRNRCENGNSWLVVKPKGTVSNRDAIGTRITIEVNGISQIREIASGRSAMGQNMRAAHFGLGKVENIDSVTVRWPSGAVESLKNVKPNQTLSLTEPR